jgi:N-acetylmuramoyl-L-alanine amidase CwlA
MVTIKRAILPQNAPNVPGRTMTPTYITVHNTANTSPGANAEMHKNYQHNGSGGRQVSWHYTVDDTEIWQTLEDFQQGWHAGDGSGSGNTRSIGIEICENSDGNFNRAVENAQWLINQLMGSHNISLGNVVSHSHWSGKYCPRKLLPTWDNFKAGIGNQGSPGTLYKVQIGAFSERGNAEQLADQATAAGFDNFIVHEGGLYKVQIGAFSDRGNAVALADQASNAGFDVYIVQA